MWRTIAGTGIAFLIGGVTTRHVILSAWRGVARGLLRRQARHRIAALIDLTWGFPLLLVAVISRA